MESLEIGEALSVSTTLSEGVRRCPSQSRSRAAELGRLVILSKEGLVVVLESNDGLYSSNGVSGEGHESASVVGAVVSVLSGDVDGRLEAGRERESNDEAPPREISKDDRLAAFSVGRARESNELRPNVILVGLEGAGDAGEAESCGLPASLVRMPPSMTWRRVRVGVADEPLVTGGGCLPNIFAALEEAEGLNILVVVVVVAAAV